MPKPLHPDGVSEENRTLLDLIQAFKPDGASDLDCALNVIQNKARAERVMIDGLRRLAFMDIGEPARMAQKILDDAYQEASKPDDLSVKETAKAVRWVMRVEVAGDAGS